MATALPMSQPRARVVLISPGWTATAVFPRQIGSLPGDISSHKENPCFFGSLWIDVCRITDTKSMPAVQLCSEFLAPTCAPWPSVLHAYAGTFACNCEWTPTAGKHA